MKTVSSFCVLVLSFWQTPALAIRGSLKVNSPSVTATTVTNLMVKQNLRRTPTETSNVPSRKLETCRDGAMFVEIDLITDQHPEETSWELYDSAGNVVSSWHYGDHGWDNMQPNDAWLETVGCIPDDDCYTLTVFDSAGDGMVSTNPDYYNGAYFVYVDSDQTFSTGLVIESSDVAFGSSISHTFGKCAVEAQDAEVCPSGTLPMTLDIATDDNGDDVSLYLVDLATETFVWNERGLDNGTAYHYLACLNVSSCANLVLSNHGQANVTVTYDGEVIYNADEQDDDGSDTVVTRNC